MFSSQITTRRVSLSSMMGLFAVGLFLIPTAFTVAQDYDSVIKRLKQAVAAKEISPEQAKQMVAALKIPSVKPAVKKNASNDKLDWEAIKKKIEGAVKAGKLTREEADAHYLALRKQTAQKPTVKKDVSNAKLDWEAAKKKIEGAVKAGKLTREEADAHYLALKKQTAQKPTVKKDASNAKLDWEAAKKKIEGAVKAGKLTREEADAHYQALKKQTSQKPAVKKKASNDKLDWEAIKKKIEGAVKAEKLTREAADAHYLASHPGKQEPNFLTHRCTACHVKSVHTPPGTKIREVPLTQRSSQQLQIRNVNGVQDIEFTGNGRKITIHDDPQQGIKIEITDSQDGKPVTRTFQAKNAEELQKKSPEAHKLYKKHSQYAPSTR
jgi:polyhydroxyalkanoate synthesis regulator phasin